MLTITFHVHLSLLPTLCLALEQAEINVSTSVAPAELSGGQSGTVTPVLSVCHSMETAPDNSYSPLQGPAEWATGF